MKVVVSCELFAKGNGRHHVYLVRVIRSWKG